MAKLYKIRFLLFVLIMIFPAHALDVIFSSALEDFKQKAVINVDIMNGRKTYVSTLNELTYQPQPYTSKVIVHIINRSRFVEIIRNAVRETRLQIAQELLEWHCELVFMGLENFEDDEYDLISGFMIDKFPESLTNLTVETIGEDHFDRVYPCYFMDIGRYQENAQICGGNLKGRLRSIASGALRPVGSNNKEIKLYGYYPLYRRATEVTWRINLANNTYSPEVDVNNDPKYNFIKRYRNKKIYLLVLGGKEYTELMDSGRRALLRTEKEEILKEMKANLEVLLIMGVFNFDWTEIDIVTQVILTHSVGSQISDYKVETYGYGMFNTYYRNAYATDGRRIRKLRKLRVLEIIRGLMGEEVKERAINMYFDNGHGVRKMPFSLSNGRYVPAEGSRTFIFPWQNQKIAFIVYDSAEKSYRINYTMVHHSVEELERSGIRVVMVEAINFGLDDVYIIAQWIEFHKGIIDPEQIAVLGGGIFDTIFQSYATTYNTFFNTKTNVLKGIRNAFVKNSNGKCISAVNIDTVNFEVWSYPINTVVNGFYEPDLIPDKKKINTNGKSILFITTSAYNFRQISDIGDAEPVTSFRSRIEQAYPRSDWRVFLVGLDNFGERDSHLFAEFLNQQTDPERVFVLSYGIRSATYQYKDTAPITNDYSSRIKTLITSCIGTACKLSNDADK